jgi:CHAD domain-containing protein
MAYRFKRGDASVQDGVRRIAVEQIDRAIAETEESALDTAEKIHRLRKRCKKLRGLVRLVRPAFNGYARENAWFRDAAAGLSGQRDLDVQIATYDALLDGYRDEVDRRAFSPVRRRLTRRRNEMAGALDLESQIEAFRGRMIDARDRAGQWTLEEDGFAAIGGGLGKTFGRAGKAMAKAARKPTTENVHDWRKRVKYHRYHARLLGPVWPGAIKAHGRAAKRLGDLLGDHHDLAVFRTAVAEAPGGVAPGGAEDALLGLIARRQAAIEEEAFRLGARLLAEPKKALTRRWESY